MTTRGMGEKEIKKIAEFIDKVLTNTQDAKAIEMIREEVKEMLKAFPLYEIN